MADETQRLHRLVTSSVKVASDGATISSLSTPSPTPLAAAGRWLIISAPHHGTADPPTQDPTYRIYRTR